MASAAQQAPRRAGAKKPQVEKPQEKQGNALQNMPRPAGIALMVLLIIASLFVGNFRALKRVTPRAFMGSKEVVSIVEDRLAAAGNAMTVARRAGLDDAVFTEIETIVNAMESAETAREVSRADQQLTAAVTEMIVSAKEKLDAENRTMLSSAADDFAEMGSFLRQQARDYNEQAQKAAALYEKLPTRFLLTQPDVYEGV